MSNDANSPGLPRTAARASYHHGDLAAALKCAALTLIAERGVEGFSLREAAQALGVAPSSAYRHYADRSSLLSAIAVDGFVELVCRFDAAMQEAQSGADTQRRQIAVRRFVAQGQAYVQFALEQPERFAVMFGRHGAANPAVRGAVLQRSAGAYATLGKALDELAAEGGIDRARRQNAEVTAWSAIHGLASLLSSGSMGQAAADPATLADQVANDVIRALGGR